MKAAAISILCFFSALASASTGFHIGNGITKNMPNIYAISTGWYYDVAAVVTANPRNVQKTAETFAAPVNVLTWVSKYGSVSQTIVGVDFPMSGLNEKGLTIQATVLAKETFPAPLKDGYALHFLQWIQYHLDTSASVAEVVQKSVTMNKPVMPMGSVDIQYQVCDMQDCAVISFYGTKAVAQGSIGKVTVDFKDGTTFTDSQPFPIAAIANYTYENNISVFNQCTLHPCPGADNIYERFNKAAEAVLSFVGAKTGEDDLILEQVFEKLKGMDQGLPLTTWNEAYLFSPRRIKPRQMLFSYKSPQRPVADRQWIDFSNEQFDCTQPVHAWWLNMKLNGGERTHMVFNSSPALQEKLVRQHSTMMTEAQMVAITNYVAAKTSCIH